MECRKEGMNIHPSYKLYFLHGYPRALIVSAYLRIMVVDHCIHHLFYSVDVAESWDTTEVEPIAQEQVLTELRGMGRQVPLDRPVSILYEAIVETP